MPSMRPYFALLLLSVVLVSYASAKSKPKNMSVWLTQLEGCNALFYVEQEPNPFLTNVIEVKDKGVVKFRRDKEMLENFPDEITVRIEYRRNPEGGFLVPPKVCDPIDASGVQFKAIWSNKSRTVTADGVVLEQQDRGPELFCELKCADLWVYKLRIDSKEVPLTDNLLIMIDSPEGKHLAKLAGGLGPLEHVVNPITPR